MNKDLKEQMVEEILLDIKQDIEPILNKSLSFWEGVHTSPAGDISNEDWDEENGWSKGTTSKARKKAYNAFLKKIKDPKFIKSLF